MSGTSSGVVDTGTIPLLVLGQWDEVFLVGGSLSDRPDVRERVRIDRRVNLFPRLKLGQVVSLSRALVLILIPVNHRSSFPWGLVGSGTSCDRHADVTIPGANLVVS